MAPFDAFLAPTSPCIPPTIAEASASDEAYFKWNGRILRNTGLVNFLDGCAATVPCHAPGEAPAGLMISGVAMADRHVLAVARSVEGVLGGRA
jgi:aspartyl-tRNA(Asn)/glutamyl-tRNA(Gln) amidotransferase subunit A